MNAAGLRWIIPDNSSRLLVWNHERCTLTFSESLIFSCNLIEIRNRNWIHRRDRKVELSKYQLQQDVNKYQPKRGTDRWTDTKSADFQAV